MIPTSVSATSLTVARQCLARYKAENIDFARNWGSDAGLLGTTLHTALEHYIREVYVDGVIQASAQALEELFELYYMKNFGIANSDEKQKEAGIKMCNDWSEREPLHMLDRKVLTLEVKEYIFIDTPVGAIKLNFILDRFDEIGPDEYEIIDYKSSFYNETIASMLKLLQPYVYAIAMYIKYPNAKLMRVTFDMLRYRPVTIEISKDQARRAFDEIYEIIESIINADENNLPETLNKSCNYCVRKATCRTLQKNIDAGGLFTLDLQGQIDLRTELEIKIKALKQLQEDLHDVVEESMGKELMTEMSTGASRAHFTIPSQNKVASFDTAKQIVGDEIFMRYGKLTMTLAQFDKMCKDTSLSDEQVEQLKALKGKEFKEPKLNFENTRSEGKTAELVPDYTDKLAPAQPRAPIPGLEE